MAMEHVLLLSQGDIESINRGQSIRYNMGDESSITIKREPTSLRNILLKETDVGDLVIIKEDGWQIGCTIIDHEDLFTRSLDNSVLESTVKSFKYEKQDWTIKNVMVVDI